MGLGLWEGVAGGGGRGGGGLGGGGGYINQIIFYESISELSLYFLLNNGFKQW